MPAAAAAVADLYRIAAALSREARSLLDAGAPRSAWVERAERLAERDVQGELLAAAAPILRGRKRATDDAVRRAVADVLAVADQLRHYVPTWDYRPVDGPDGDEVLVAVPAPESADRLTLIRAAGRGAFRRLAGLVGAGTADPGDGGDVSPLERSPVLPAILALLASAPRPVRGWKAVRSAIDWPSDRERPADGTVRRVGSELRKLGYLDTDSDLIAITEAGRQALVRFYRL